jgi:hypothetical protein
MTSIQSLLPTFNAQDPNFITEIEKYYALPTPGTIVQFTSAQTSDPTFYMSDAYIKQLNLNSVIYNCNLLNQQAYNQFDYLLKMWNQTVPPRSGAVPATPKYYAVDQNLFNNWWASYSANPGVDQPAESTMLDDVTPPYPNIISTTPQVTTPMPTSLVGASGGNGWYQATTVVQALNLPVGYSIIGPNNQMLYLYKFGNVFVAGQYMYLWGTQQPAN